MNRRHASEGASTVTNALRALLFILAAFAVTACHSGAPETYRNAARTRFAAPGRDAERTDRIVRADGRRPTRSRRSA